MNRLTENETKPLMRGCAHSFEDRRVLVKFFAGAYWKRMYRCRLCNGFVAEDMRDHPNGVHELVVLVGGGFVKCRYCELTVDPRPVLALGGDHG